MRLYCICRRGAPLEAPAGGQGRGSSRLPEGSQEHLRGWLGARVEATGGRDAARDLLKGAMYLRGGLGGSAKASGGWPERHEPGSQGFPRANSGRQRVSGASSARGHLARGEGWKAPVLQAYQLNGQRPGRSTVSPCNPYGRGKAPATPYGCRTFLGVDS